jgi:ABC-type branched-subunit amino acid transport system ATPase component
VLLISEPPVDPALAAVAGEIYSLIKDSSRSGMTILLVDQNGEQPVKASDDVYFLKMGILKDHGSSERVPSSAGATIEQKETS